jgi:UDPglucose 6-dehydrogenase
MKIVAVSGGFDPIYFGHTPYINNLNCFKKKTDLIIANRMNKEIEDVSYKVFSRDLFREN